LIGDIMFNGLIKYLECETCGERFMHFDIESTLDDYSHPDVFTLDNVDNIIDGIIAEYLVYVCSKCGAKGKYTIKEIEKRVRKELSKQLLTAMAKQEMASHNFHSKKAKVLIYCGKCTGLDGKGSCLVPIYNKCKLKRIPRGL